MKFHVGQNIVDMSLYTARRLLRSMERCGVKGSYVRFDLSDEPRITPFCGGEVNNKSIPTISIPVNSIDNIADHLRLQIQRAEGK